MQAQKIQLMKNLILFLFCLIFGISNAQLSTTMPTTAEIDREINKARKLSISDPAKSITLSDQTFHVSKEIGYKKGMMESSLILMTKYFDAGNFRKVIDISKEAEKLSIELKDNKVLANTHRLRASAYTEIGFNDESIREFNKALNISGRLANKNDRNYQKALIYIGIGSYAAHMNMPLDSVIYYQKKCLEKAVAIEDHKDFVTQKYFTLALSYINLGKTSVAARKINDAETYFARALEICQNKKYRIDGSLELSVLNEYAWLYYDQKKYDKVIDYAGRASQLEKQISSPYIRRDIYEVYFKSYVELGEKEASKKYMHLYTKLNDSLVNIEKKTINTPVKHIMGEQEHTYTSNIKKILLLSSGTIIALFLLGLYLWKKKQKKHHVKYDTIVTNLKSTGYSAPVQNLSSTSLSDKGIGITDETANAILMKLEKFEKSQKFIKKDVSLTSLANDLGTNTRYLSEVIKQYKGKNYSHYINSLRVDYIIQKLYENPIYREYKISYLAEACGFSSREVFAVIFKKETGVTPSYFINNLKKDY